MKPRVSVPDAERLTRDLLADLIWTHEPDVSVEVGVPKDWTPKSPPHLQVSWGGTPVHALPVLAYATVRIVAWAASTSEAKRLAALAEGLLLASTSDDISGFRALTSVQPARDPETRAELASVSLRATLRTQPIQEPESA